MKKLLIFVLFVCFLSLNANAKEQAIFHGNRNLNHIYLTFDDGYSAKNTEMILDTLLQKDVKATFFIEGEFLTQNPILVNRIANEQTLANHTFKHKDITKMSNQQLIDDIKIFEEEAFKITGKQLTKYFRPPMGKINDTKLNILSQMGYKVFIWDVSYYDYVYYDDQGIDYVLNSIRKQTHNGSIILMHTLTKSNALALGQIIDMLRDLGYVFSDLSELV